MEYSFDVEHLRAANTKNIRGFTPSGTLHQTDVNSGKTQKVTENFRNFGLKNNCHSVHQKHSKRGKHQGLTQNHSEFPYSSRSVTIRSMLENKVNPRRDFYLPVWQSVANTLIFCLGNIVPPFIE